MIRLPAALQRRLEELFPRARDREQFVADLLEKALDEEASALDDMPQNIGGSLHLFTDGGSRGNPGEAAIAYILEDPAKGEIVEENGECIGVETNNVAEYRALIEGLKAAQNFHPNRLVCHLDSELIVRQINGDYKVKMATLQPLFEEVKELSLTFADIIFKHIPRGDNYRADALVNKVLNEQAKHPSIVHPLRPANPPHSQYGMFPER